MTQMTLSVAVPGAIDTAESDKNKTNDEKNCQVLVRVQRPSGDGPWYAGGKLGGQGQDDELTGHTFCSHINESKSKKWYGFYPKGAIDGWDGLPEDDMIAGPKDFFKYVAGVLYNGDADHPYDDEKVYDIEKDKYEKSEKFAMKWKQDKKKYSLALQNCTTYVRKDAKVAGCPVPGSGWPFDNPKSFGKKL